MRCGLGRAMRRSSPRRCGPEGRPSFLKKRSKKLLIFDVRLSHLAPSMRKSFLVLFFKKELLFSPPFCISPPGQ
jgi:hypothetical protein